jgi:6-phosphogluconolactonase
MNTAAKLKAYVGTYTTGESEGIYSFLIDTTSGKIENITLEAKLDNPTYVALSKDNNYLYSVVKAGSQGGTASYSIKETETLKLVNQHLEEGSSPCHVSLDSTDKYVFSANYHKGEVMAFPVKEDGGLKEASAHEVHEGSGPNPKRQEKPHAHYAALTLDDKYLCVVDLGIDKVLVYTFNEGKLIKHSEITFKPGCGPRHMAFHPNKNYAYIMTELSSEVVALEYNEREGCFDILQYISALPENYKEESSGSAIHVSPDGRFLYAANRGHDSIAVFAVNESTGMLQFVEHTPSEGLNPRDFTIVPGGNLLIAANQDSNTIVPFSINKTTGRLSRTGDVAHISKPVCIKFLNI